MILLSQKFFRYLCIFTDKPKLEVAMLTVKKTLEAGLRVEDKYIQDRSDLASHVNLLRQSGFTIALTQGVYDMFHVGHARYLAQAKICGDILIVGVDSDELTRSMKGPDRPFDTFEDRIELLAMLACVNIIVKRDVDEHKYDLIKRVHPDVLVMSQTTHSFGEEDKLALSEYCGEIKHLKAQAATSTTAKLRRLKIDGARELADKVKGKLEIFSAEIVDLMQESLKGEGDE